MSTVVVVGAGAAGLSFASFLAQMQPSTRRRTGGVDDDAFSCVLIDPDDKKDNDRTWSFWGGPCAYDELVTHRWPGVVLADQNRTVVTTWKAAECSYRSLPADRFYAACREVIDTDARFSWVRGRAQDIEERAGGVTVRGTRRDGTPFSVEADFVLDSVFGPSDNPNRRDQPAFYQSFVGWEIACDAPIFDDRAAVLMDFSHGADRYALEFGYVLPTTSRTALVEYTTVDRDQPGADYLETRLIEEMERRAGNGDWRIIRREKGTIPLFLGRFPARQHTGRVVHVGVQAGAARPTTGYAFRSIVDTSRALAERFARTGRLAGLPPRRLKRTVAHARLRPRFYDAVFLEVLRGEPSALPAALVGLCARSPAHRVFRFLAGGTNLLEEAAIVLSLPWGPFLRALGRLGVAVVLRRDARAGAVYELP